MGSCCHLEGLKGLKKPVVLGGQVEVILLWSRALGDPERLFQGYFIVSLESAVFLSGSGSFSVSGHGTFVLS